MPRFRLLVRQGLAGYQGCLPPLSGHQSSTDGRRSCRSGLGDRVNDLEAIGVASVEAQEVAYAYRVYR